MNSLTLIDGLTVATFRSAHSQHNHTVGLGSSHYVRVTGLAADTLENPTFLQLTLRSNGALVHRQMEQLCRLYPKETAGHIQSSVQRRCRMHASPARFDARTLMYVPKNTPSRLLQPVQAVHNATLAQAAFERSWKLASDEQSTQFPGQVMRWDMHVLFKALHQALKTLPLPFTILWGCSIRSQHPPVWPQRYPTPSDPFRLTLSRDFSCIPKRLCFPFLQ